MNLADADIDKDLEFAWETQVIVLVSDVQNEKRIRCGLAVLWGMLNHDELPQPQKELIRLYSMKTIETIIEMDIELEAEVHEGTHEEMEAVLAYYKTTRDRHCCMLLWFVPIAHKIGDEFWARLLLYACFSTGRLSKVLIRCLEEAWIKGSPGSTRQLVDGIHCVASNQCHEIHSSQRASPASQLINSVRRPARQARPAESKQ